VRERVSDRIVLNREELDRMNPWWNLGLIQDFLWDCPGFEIGAPLRAHAFNITRVFHTP
jgi:hypothetical protein